MRTCQYGVIQDLIKKGYIMKRIVLSIIFIVVMSIANDTVDYSFTSGGTIKASEMNANFNKLASKITELRGLISNNSQKSSKRRVLVGVSTQTHNGDAGIITMNKSCNIKYSGSSMCSSKEIMYSHDASMITTQVYASVIPELREFGIINSSHQRADISGVKFDYGAVGTCRGYNDNSNHNIGKSMLLVNLPKGKFTRTSCSSRQVVACCK